MREVDSIEQPGMACSICMLGTDLDNYRRMHSSFVEAAFTEADCEFIYIENIAKQKVSTNILLQR